MRFLLDTNIMSDLVRHPCGRIADRIERVGEQQICTSIIVAAELHYGATKKVSERLMRQLEVVLSAVDVLALEAPTDTVYGELRIARFGISRAAVEEDPQLSERDDPHIAAIAWPNLGPRSLRRDSAPAHPNPSSVPAYASVLRGPRRSRR
jgi:predicted nucleic acid-binding protein